MKAYELKKDDLFIVDGLVDKEGTVRVCLEDGAEEKMLSFVYLSGGDSQPSRTLYWGYEVILVEADGNPLEKRIQVPVYEKGKVGTMAIPVQCPHCEADLDEELDVWHLQDIGVYSHFEGDRVEGNGEYRSSDSFSSYHYQCANCGGVLADASMARDTQAYRVNRSTLANKITAAADSHGNAEGTDHEVGDLSDVFCAAFNLLSEEGVRNFADHPHVKDLLEKWGGVEDFNANIPSK